jgi:hypothetical protein
MIKQTYLSLVSVGLLQLSLLSTQAQSEVVSAEESTIFDGKGLTSVQLDKRGRVQSVTLSVSLQSLTQNLPDEAKTFILTLPKAVQDQTIFNHVTIDWNPHGHAPMMVYDKPHFDFHFFGPTAETIAEIDCSSTKAIPDNLVLPGYVLPPAEAADRCVPQMGIHAIPVADMETGFDFWQTFIYGYYDGKLIFLEPMLTSEFFKAKKAISAIIEMPGSALQEMDARSYPTAYSIYYDERLDAYQFVFSHFTGTL